MPRLIGAFILFAALLFFVQASAQMFMLWDNMKGLNDCFAKNSFSPEFNVVCQSLAKDSLGVYVTLDQSELSLRQFWGLILGPIATILFWLAVLFFGWMVYKTGDLVIPIEESSRNLPEHHARHHKRH